MKIRSVLCFKLVIVLALTACSDDNDKISESRVMAELNFIKDVYNKYVETGGLVADGDHDISFLQKPYGDNMSPILLKNIVNPQGESYRINITRSSIKYYTKITLSNGEVRTLMLEQPVNK